MFSSGIGVSQGKKIVLRLLELLGVSFGLELKPKRRGKGRINILSITWFPKHLIIKEWSCGMVCHERLCRGEW